jgi:hypothetical protein
MSAALLGLSIYRRAAIARKESRKVCEDIFPNVQAQRSYGEI